MAAIIRAHPSNFNYFFASAHFKLLHTRIFSFYDPVEQQLLARINRTWSHAIRNNLFVVRIDTESCIRGNKGCYNLLHSITREQAAKLFEQAGMQVPIKPGERVLNNFSIGEAGRHQQVFNGGVYIGHNEKTQEFFAIKKMRRQEAIRKELLFQRSFQNVRHILPAYDQCRVMSSDQVLTYYQIQRLAGLGAVDKIIPMIQSLKDQTLKEQLIYLIMEGLFEGLAAMHDRGYANLDVKPSNMLVQSNGAISIIDFECAAKMKDDLIDAKEEEGDEEYYSPERWLQCHDLADGKCIGSKIDAWSTGLILLSLLGIDTSPFSQTQMDQMVVSVTSNKGSVADLIRKLDNHVETSIKLIYSTLGSFSPDSHWALAKALLLCNPESRLSVKEALQHPWMLKMGASFGWRERAKERLVELVQSQTREKRVDIISPVTLSPQELPFVYSSRFVSRPTLQDQLRKAIASANYETSSRFVYYGMGGAGKSLLATACLHEPEVRNKFNLRLWFNSADDPSILEAQYVILAREWGLVDEKASFSAARDAVFRYLDESYTHLNQPWIAVFDNADTPEKLSPFLPPKGGQIIITTRSTTWTGSVKVDLMTPTEGMALAKMILDCSSLDAKKLYDSLEGHPLGIAQACAFIRNQTLTVDQYLRIIEEESKMLVDEPAFGVKLPNSLLSLWERTFNLLARSQPQSLNLLKSLAYLSPDGVHEEIIKKLDSYSPEAYKLLVDYSLISEGNRIHRLLQVAVRHKYQSDEQPIVTDLMQHLDTMYDLDEQEISSEKSNKLFPHGQMLRHYCKKINNPGKPLQTMLIRTLRWMAHAQTEFGQPSISREMLEQSLALAKQVHGDFHHEVAWSYNNLGMLHRELGDFSEALRCLKEALEIRKAVFGTPNLNAGMTYDNMGTVLSDMQNLEEAAKAFDNALQIFTSLKEPLAVFRDMRKSHEAAEAFDNVWQIFTLFERSPDTLRNTLIDTLRDELRSKEAAKAFENALQIFTLKEPLAANTYNNLGLLYRDQEDFEKAHLAFLIALQMKEKLFGPDSLQMASTLNNLGSLLMVMKEVDKALKYMKRSLEIKERFYGKRHPQYALTLQNLGTIFLLSGKWEEALPDVQASLEIFRDTYGTKHVGVAKGLLSLGQIYILKGHYGEGVAYMEEALAIQKTIFGEKSPTVGFQLLAMARHLEIRRRASGIVQRVQQAKMVEFLEQALEVFKAHFGPDSAQVESTARFLKAPIERDFEVLRGASAIVFCGNYNVARRNFKRRLGPTPSSQE